MNSYDYRPSWTPLSPITFTYQNIFPYRQLWCQETEKGLFTVWIIKTISEGEMWGVNIMNFTEWVEKNRDLIVKFIIFHEVVLVHVLPNLLRGRKSKTSVIQCWKKNNWLLIWEWKWDLPDAEFQCFQPSYTSRNPENCTSQIPGGLRKRDRCRGGPLDLSGRGWVI